MPLSSFRLARMWLASGLLIVTTFTSAWAQETPVDPNYQDLILPEQTVEGFLPVSPLAKPEIDYANCAPAPAAWHPPILFPKPEYCCPTGVVHRDWIREHTTPRWLNYRQRMLEKDYAWRVQNGHQPTCCPPWSCWGHSCDECSGIGCKKRWRWFGGHHGEACNGECGVHHACQQSGHETSAVNDASSQGVILVSNEVPASGEPAVTEGAETVQPAPIADAPEVIPAPVVHHRPQTSCATCNVPDPHCAVPCVGQVSQAGANPAVGGIAGSGEFVDSAVTPSSGEALTPLSQPVPGDVELTGQETEGRQTQTDSVQQVSDQQLSAKADSGVETAGFCEVSDGCAPKGGSVYTSGPVYMSHGPYMYGDDCWEECEDGHRCFCPACCLKRRLGHCRDCFCKYLREDGPFEDYDGGNGSRFRREIPAMGQYWMAYPVDPYHFDQRDGRIYGAQGYGHAVGVPLAPNVEHTFNYGWGLPSSRLTPVSRMPGAPGVAIPAVPGAVGPGVMPPAYSSPLSAGLGQ